jgi:phosphomannomutase
LPENITEIQKAVIDFEADLGIIVDPDVDRLAFVSDDGTSFGEEYTLVAVADYILSHIPGNTVSNLSSTLALRDITTRHDGKYHSSAVGEVNVVIGGEGNGGIIYPDLHYGRDAMVGIALFLSSVATKNMTVSSLRSTFPKYEMSKNKIQLSDILQINQILENVKLQYSEFEVNTTDGVKITMNNEWVHLRKSNTEPIIRIYAESQTKEKADFLASSMIQVIEEIQKNI